MEKELDFIPIKSFQQQKRERLERNKILQEKQEKIVKAKVEKSVKRFVFGGTFILAFATSLAFNGKHLANTIIENNQIEKNFRPIYEDAQEIVSENTNIAKNTHTGISEPQYDHMGIAIDVENYVSKFGKLQGDALLAAVLDVSKDNAYQNDDRIIRALPNDFVDAQTAEEYVHSLGYENTDEYLEAMKEVMYNENQRQETIEKYENQESELKR